MKINPNKTIEDSWVNVPRKILSLFRNGSITALEFAVYMYLRVGCNPLGICATSLTDIRDDILKTSTNHANKILLSLKSKKLVWYKRRQGGRGSFEVHFGDFILPTKAVRTLNDYFEQKDVRSDSTTSTESMSEAEPEVNDASQKLEEQKNVIKSNFSWLSKNYQVRSYNTDTYNKNKKNTDTSYDVSRAKPSVNETFNRNLLTNNGFYPQNSDEERIWFIAREVDEENMRFLLATLNKHGLPLIEEAYKQYSELKTREKIKNPAAYLNKIIQSLISEKEK